MIGRDGKKPRPCIRESIRVFSLGYIKHLDIDVIYDWIELKRSSNYSHTKICSLMKCLVTILITTRHWTSLCVWFIYWFYLGFFAFWEFIDYLMRRLCLKSCYIYQILQPICVHVHSQHYNTTKINKQEVIFVKISRLNFCIAFVKNVIIAKLFVTNEGKNEWHVDHEIP